MNIETINAMFGRLITENRIKINQMIDSLMKHQNEIESLSEKLSSNN